MLVLSPEGASGKERVQKCGDKAQRIQGDRLSIIDRNDSHSLLRAKEQKAG